MADIVRAGSLWGYCQLTQFMAYDPSALLSDAGLSRADLENPDKYLPRPAVASLLEHTASALECPHFGLKLAGVQDVYILGALSFAVRNALDMRNAIAIASKHIHYQAPMATLAIEALENGEELIVFHAPPPAEGVTDQYTEHALGLFCRIVRQLTNGRATPDRVAFRHAQRASLSEYEDLLGLQPVFNAANDSVLLGRDDLSIPFGPANQHLQTLVESYLDMYAPAPRAEIERQTHDALMQIMRAGPASIEDVADMLRMHPRTLQRRLMASGTTFERVRDNVRKSMAEFYLASDVVPLAEVAHLLGYANQSALTRSCVRWFGTTPLAFRRKSPAQAIGELARQEAPPYVNRKGGRRVHPLDKLVWTALSTRQQGFSEGNALARRMRTDVGPFAAAADASPAAIAALAALVPDGGDISLLEPCPPEPPAGIERTLSAAGVQMMAQRLSGDARAAPFESLGDSDAEEMRALALLTKPGPFNAKTHTIGRFIGVRDNGRLIAMAGERMQTDDFVEVSGICTHPDFRGRGLAAALTCAVTDRILREGRTPFLHAYASNTGAIALYRKLGFELRAEVTHAVWKRAA